MVNCLENFLAFKANCLAIRNEKKHFYRDCAIANTVMINI